jgi:hypothetical protein
MPHFTSSNYSYQASATPPAPAPPLFCQQWNTYANTAPVHAHTMAPPPPLANTPSQYFIHRQEHPDRCAFCPKPGHRICTCTIAEEYIISGRAALVNNQIHLPNSQPVPNDGSRCSIQASIDRWLATQPPAAQTHATTIHKHPTTACIKEVIETHILQVVAAEHTSGSNTTNELQDIFEVFMAEK